MTIHQVVVNTSLAKLRITCDEQQLMRIEFVDPQLKTSVNIPSLAKMAVQQISAYFSDRNRSFDLPLVEADTEFQQRVRAALLKIPAGSTRTYQQLAQQLKTSPRAIGNACRANRFPIVIPCHRIVAINGLGGFAGKLQGYQIDLKAALLNHEKV